MAYYQKNSQNKWLYGQQLLNRLGPMRKDKNDQSEFDCFFVTELLALFRFFR